MKALITGSAGFVGRHTVAELDRRGWDTVGMDIVEPEASTDAVEFFRYAPAHMTYDLIVHAAASAPHRAAIDGEYTHMARNVQLDAAMFDWAVRTGQGRVIYLSSSAAYPTYLQEPSSWQALEEDHIDLTDAEEPDSVYGWTKLTGERMAVQARKAGLDVTVVRPFSGYGEDQSENFPFRAILERVKRREDPLTIWGDGTQVRDWIHIDDVVAGMLAVAESGTEDPVNLCTGLGTTMLQLAELACYHSGWTPETVKRLTDKPAGVAYRVGDPDRFNRFYVPSVSLSEGVRRALG